MILAACSSPWPHCCWCSLARRDAHGQQVPLAQLVGSFFVGDEVTLGVLRDGQEHQLHARCAARATAATGPATPLTAPLLAFPHSACRLNVPLPLVATSSQAPSYLVLGGLVLTPLSLPYLEQTFGRQSWVHAAPPSLLALVGAHPAVSPACAAGGGEGAAEGPRGGGAASPTAGAQDGAREVQQAVVVAWCQEESGALQGYNQRLLLHKRVTGFRVHRRGAAGKAGEAGGAGGVPRGAGGAAGGAREEPWAGQGGAAGLAASSSAPEQPLPPMTPVHNLRQLAAGLLACQGEDAVVWLELEGRVVVVMDARQAEADTRGVLEAYGVSHRVSKDLEPLLVDLVDARPLGGGGGGARTGKPRLGGARKPHQ